MKLKYVAASKLLLSNWSIPKLDRVLERDARRYDAGFRLF